MYKFVHNIWPRSIFLGCIVAVLGIKIGIDAYMQSPSIQTGFLGKCAAYCMYPLIRLQHVCISPVRVWYRRRIEIQDLRDEYEALKNQYDELHAYAIALRESLDYWNDVEPLHAFRERYDAHNGKIAQILLRNFDENEHFFLVEGGSSTGITEGMIAIYQNMIIGKVSCVYPYYCKVVLVTDKSTRIGVYCRATKSVGIYEGTGSLEWGKLTYVNHLKKMQLDDVLVSNGHGLIYPRGFIIGTVQSLGIEGVYHDVRIKPMVDSTALEYCVLMHKMPTGNMHG